MNVLAGIEPPTAGQVHVGGRDLGRMDARERKRYRRETVGYCWQRAALNLAGDLTARQNVEVPLLAGGLRSGVGRRAREVLDRLGAHHRAALTLRYLDGLPVPEVARHLDRTVHATEALLVRARTAFRRIYEGEEGSR